MPIEYYSPVSGGAIATVIMSTGRELLARGHQVSVITRVNGDGIYGVGDVMPIEMWDRSNLHFFQRRLSSIRQRIHGWDWPYFEHYLRSVLEKLARMTPIPDAVVVCNDLVSPSYIKQNLPRTKVIAWLHNECHTRFDMRKTIESTDVFVTCSDYIRQWTSAHYDIPAGDISVALNGVDAGVFKPGIESRRDGEEVKVLFLGRIDPNKGPDLAVDAVAALRAEKLPVSITVAGGLWFYGHGNEMSDPFFRSLKAKMDAAGAEYLGHVTRARIPALVRRHDVACVLSRSNEPFGLTALEAMAGGCAVVASGRGGLPEACGGAALVADPDDLQSVIAALRSLVTDRKLLNLQKQKSLERAARASWSGCADVFERAVLGNQGEIRPAQLQAMAA